MLAEGEVRHHSDDRDLRDVLGRAVEVDAIEADREVTFGAGFPQLEPACKDPSVLGLRALLGRGACGHPPG